MLIRGALRWAALAVLYFAFAGQFSASEVTAALLAGLAAAAFSLLLREAAEQELILRAPWHRLLPRLLWAVLRDTGRVGAALAVAVRSAREGAFSRQPCSAEAAGQRGLAILLASLAPNGYVLREDGAVLELHRLAPAPPSADRAWPL